MKLKHFTLIAFILFGLTLNAQDNETKTEKLDQTYLKTLHKANGEDLNGKEISLDGESIPVYDLNGQRIKGMTLMNAFMTGDFVPDFYLNSQKDIKLVILRKPTEAEKKQMQSAQAQMSQANSKTGTEAPDFSVTDIKKNKYSLKDLKGKIVVINFWFRQCKPCVMEIPELNKLVKEYADKEVIFLGFSLDDAYQAEKFLEKTPFAYQIVPNCQVVANDYGVSSYPTHIIIDQNGKIAFETSGLSANTVENVKQTIDQLLTQKFDKK